MKDGAALLRDAVLLRQQAESFCAVRPSLQGAERLLRAVRSEAASAALLAERPAADASRLQGLENNVSGYAAELACAQQAPDVVALRRTVFSRSSAALGDEAREAREVDVVAQKGSLWLVWHLPPEIVAAASARAAAA